jgi:hypothetical protein
VISVKPETRNSNTQLIVDGGTLHFVMELNTGAKKDVVTGIITVIR